jgi:hypothetical protein
LFGSLVQYGAAGQLLKHRLRRQFSHTIRTSPLIWFPRYWNNFIQKILAAFNAAPDKVMFPAGANR